MIILYMYTVYNDQIHLLNSSISLNILNVFDWQVIIVHIYEVQLDISAYVYKMYWAIQGD